MTERRLLFGSVAERYDSHRPSYPAELVDEVLAYAGAQPGTRALEVGAGTGIATRLFAARDLEITAVEPDPAMAAVASQRAATDGISVDLRISDFEHLEFEPHSFQLLYSATAWHWVDPDRRYPLAGRALGSGGALAAFWNRPLWDQTPIRAGLDEAYAPFADVFAEIYPGPMNPLADPNVINADDWTEELATSSEFGDLETRTYKWTLAYTREEYLGNLGTHSDHILLPAAAREQLFKAIGEVIDQHAGSFEMQYQALLCLARRR